MDDRQRTELEHAALNGCPFEQPPRWHFLFIENPEILQEMEALFPEERREKGITDAVIAFSARSASSAADAGAALNRMYEAASSACRFSDSFTVFFSRREAEALKEAFGVPEGYVCAGALVFSAPSEEKPEVPLRWDVFSYMK